MTLLASLDAAAGDGRDMPAAVTVSGRSLSRSELHGAASAVAARIAGAPSVIVEATASVESVVAVVAGLLAGVPLVPVAPDAGPVERGHVLADSGAAVLLAAPGAPVWEAVTTLHVDVAERADQSWPEPKPDSTAMILYTSGTTGPPKGVPLRRAAIAADLDALADAWGWNAGDRLVHGLPLFHVHGLVLGVLGPLRIGSSLVHTGRPTPVAYAAAAAGGGSLFFGVPTVWSRVVADPPSAQALRSARLLVSGSAPLPAPVFTAMETLVGKRPVERYGMTETLITTSTTAGGERRPGWVGTALAGVETRLVELNDAQADSPDATGVAADGESIGELQVRGPTVMAGYLNRPDADVEVFHPGGWFATGDVACIDPGGFHRILGRRSVDLIKSGGYRIGAGEVEAALLAHPGVSEAAVVGVADDDLGQAVVAFVVAEGVIGTELAEFVASSLSVHKRPRRVELVDELPRNAMGKIQKAALIERG